MNKSLRNLLLFCSTRLFSLCCQAMALHPDVATERSGKSSHTRYFSVVRNMLGSYLAEIYLNDRFVNKERAACYQSRRCTINLSGCDLAGRKCTRHQSEKAPRRFRSRTPMLRSNPPFGGRGNFPCGITKAGSLYPTDSAQKVPSRLKQPITTC